MIKVEREFLNILSEKHYNDFFIANNNSHLLNELYRNEKNPDKKSFYYDIIDNIHDIITGAPTRLRELIEYLFGRHERIMYAFTFYNIEKKSISIDIRNINRRIATAKKNIIKYSHAKDTQKLYSVKLVVETIKKYQKLKYAEDLKKHRMVAEEIINDFSEIFNYEAFTSQPKHAWGAYTLANELQVNVCPYCNRQYTHTFVGEEGGSMRPQFDHFFAKSIYPFFSISFFNLIPSCYICNSSFKSDKDFYLEEHINPYEEGFDDKVKFSVQFLKGSKTKIDYVSLWFTPHSEVFRLRLIDSYNDKDFSKRAKGSIKTFHLEEIYEQCHSDYVSELLIKSREYNEDAIDFLMLAFRDLFVRREDVIRLVTNNFVALNDLGKRPLAKLTRDITREFGIQ
ncbi:hypothetical protein [Paenibacillus andongensis]|uniref:hypothetical protein n=1 Tax=Paenibacillus andongensis TaxID=2975482 RepID=UPI0021BAD8F6|nr:hypothetical protein [Paenibacillus andongensis]